MFYICIVKLIKAMKKGLTPREILQQSNQALELIKMGIQPLVTDKDRRENELLIEYYIGVGKI